MRKWLLAVLVILAGGSIAPAHAATIFTASLDGAQAGIVTPASGTASVLLSTDQSTLTVDVTFQDLIGTTTAAHIHCCAGPGTSVGIALPFVGFPTAVTSGTYAMSFDLTSDASYNAGFLGANGGTAAGAQAALIANMLAGLTYVNIHTTFAPPGEIRGQLAAVPEPSSLALIGFGLLALVFVARRRFAAAIR